jgi:hypothetical protein
MIPSVHRDGKKRTASLQIITEDGAWSVPFSGREFQKKKNQIFLGENRFGKEGIRLKVDTPQLKGKGHLRFGTLTPLTYDIMGPFALIPRMECRHFVWSMLHTVFGTINLNGKKYIFANDCGYWEGDRGRSFPRQYAWTQCFFKGGSLMLSVAEIPMAGFSFTGAIGVIRWKGKEYRLATYLGAKVSWIQGKKIRVIQGKLEIEAHLLEEKGMALQAPKKGKMERTIYESAAVRASYRFRKEKQTVFSFETERASFEYEYKN